MKIGIKNTKLFFPYVNSSSNVLNKILYTPNINKDLFNGIFYPVDMYCMRTFYQNKGNTIQERFNECEECSNYKQYRELIRMKLANPLYIIKYEVMLSGRVDDNNIYFDEFSNLTIINHLLSRKVGSLNVPLNAFVCGKTGYMFYKIYKNKKTTIKDIKYIIKEFMSYNISFISFPIINGELITLTTKSAITIDKRRILPYGYDITGIKNPFIYQSKYFTIKVNDNITVQSWIMSGKVKQNVIQSINTIALYINSVNNKKLSHNNKFWNSLFIEQISIEETNKIKTFDEMLKFLNGVKIKYMR